MTGRRHRRRISAYLAILCAIAAVVWLFGGVVLDGPDAVPEEAVADQTHDAHLLRGEIAGGLAVGAPDRVLDADEPIPHGPVRAQVVGRWGTPVPGVGVVARRADNTVPLGDLEQHPKAPSDTNGWVYFKDLPHDGSWHLEATFARKSDELMAYAATKSRSVSASVRVRGPVVTLELPALPLDVRVQTGDDGQDMHRLSVMASPLLAGVDWETGDGERLWIRAGSQPKSDVSVSVPKSQVPEDYIPSDTVSGVPISPRARELTATVPMRREAEFYVVPTSPGEWSYTIMVEGKRVAAKVDADGFGRERVYGVAFRPGMRVFALAHDAKSRKQCWGRIDFSHDAEDMRVMTMAKMDKNSRKVFAAQIPSVQVHLAAGVGYGVRLRIQGGTPTPPIPLWADFKRAKPRPQPQVEVRIQGDDGRPAINARAVLRGKTGTTDSIGRVFFKNLPAGDHTLAVWGAGACWAETVHVADVRRQVIRVRVPPAGTVDLEVVDEDGRSIPYAVISIDTATPFPWCDLEQGIQRLDPFTGVDGRRRLHNYPPGRKTTIHVTCGTLNGSANVNIRAGATETVRIVLERKKPAPPKKKGDRVVPWAGSQAKINLHKQLNRKVREELLKKFEAAKERATRK